MLDPKATKETWNTFISSIKLDKNINPATILLPKYHKFLNLSSRKLAKTLPPHREGVDHHIKLIPGKTPPFGPLYNITRKENEELRAWLNENLIKGFIRASQSPAASPVLFIKKVNKAIRKVKLYLYIDYRGLNAITVKSWYPLPLISETLNRLSKAVIYTKLDIITAFNRIRMAKGEEWITVLRT